MTDKIGQFNIRLPKKTLHQLKVKCVLAEITQQEVGEAFVKAFLADKIKIKRDLDGKIKIS